MADRLPTTIPGSGPTSLRSAAGKGDERLKGFAPDCRWRTLTFLAALRAAALTRLASSMPAGASPWRHRHPRPRRRRQARVPATLLAGLRSDRAGIRQGQALAAQWPGTIDRGHPRPRRKTCRRHRSKRMRKLTSATPDMLPAKPASL
jgi:hypothetical protein